MKADYDNDVLIDTAWRHPEMKKWQPSERHPTASINIRPKASPGGLILPPRLHGDIDLLPIFTIHFHVEFGTVEGRPAFQIVGSCRGDKKVVHQGWCGPASV